MGVAHEIIEDLNLNPDEVMLGQGTLRPDLIESASGLASGQVNFHIISQWARKIKKVQTKKNREIK